MNNNTTEDNNEEDKDRLITLPEAAKLYGFHSEYLSNLLRKGRLTGKKLGKFWVTTPNDVETFIKSRKKRGVYRDDIDIDK